MYIFRNKGWRWSEWFEKGWLQKEWGFVAQEPRLAEDICTSQDTVSSTFLYFCIFRQYFSLPGRRLMHKPGRYLWYFWLNVIISVNIYGAFIPSTWQDEEDGVKKNLIPYTLIWRIWCLLKSPAWTYAMSQELQMCKISPLLFSNVFSNRLIEQMQSHIRNKKTFFFCWCLPLYGHVYWFLLLEGIHVFTYLIFVTDPTDISV